MAPHLVQHLGTVQNIRERCLKLLRPLQYISNRDIGTYLRVQRLMYISLVGSMIDYAGAVFMEGLWLFFEILSNLS